MFNIENFENIIGEMYLKNRKLVVENESLKNELKKAEEKLVQAHITSMRNDDAETEITELRKTICDLTAKKDKYRNERYELKNKVKALSRSIKKMEKKNE